MSDFFSPASAMLQVTQQRRRLLQNVTGTVGGLASQVAGRILEAERVSQISSGLVAMEKSFQDYNRTLPQKEFPNPSGTGEGGAWSLAQVDEEILQADHEQMVQSQREWIERNVRNRGAREQLLQTLEQKSVANYGQVAGLWETYHINGLRAQSNQNIQTVLESNADLPTMKAKIQAQLTADVNTLVRKADDAAIYQIQLFDQAESASAYAGALRVVEQTQGNQEAVNQWIDQNTNFWNDTPDKREALKGVMGQQIENMRTQRIRAEQEYDRKATTDFLNAYEQLWENPTGLRQTLDKVRAFDWKDPATQEAMFDKFASRIEALEARELRVAAGGGDPDNQDNDAYIDEWNALYLAIETGQPLTTLPQYAPPNAESLAPGRVPSPQDLYNWLAWNQGSTPGPDGVLQPRIRRAFAESNMKSILDFTPSGFSEVAQLIYDASRPSKDANGRTVPAAMTPAVAAAKVMELKQRFKAGDITAEELVQTAAKWATDMTVGKIVADNMPVRQGALTGAGLIDPLEAFINKANNDQYYHYDMLPEDQRREIEMNISVAERTIGARVQERIGEIPTRSFVQTNIDPLNNPMGTHYGEVYVWYADPAAPNNTRRGRVYRYRPEKVENGMYTGGVPVLQLWAGDHWQDVTDTTTAAERSQAEIDRARAQQAASTLLAEGADRRIAGMQPPTTPAQQASQTALEAATSRPRLEDWIRTPDGYWINKSTRQMATTAQADILDSAARTRR